MTKGVIAAGDPLTAKAGADILRQGGNAFDAALAAMLAAPMSEPILTSMGGGGFMLAYEAGKRPVLYDFFVDVPPNRGEHPDFFPIEVDFGTTTQEFHIGTASIAVPGMVAGIDMIHQDLGSLPMGLIATPARHYARDGVMLSDMQAGLVDLISPILLSTQEAKRLFAPDGSLIDQNAKWHNKEYGDFLDIFAREGAEVFYQGEIANKLDKLSREKRGILRREDLNSYTVQKRDPIIFDYRDKRIATNPPPSAGGILIAFALEMLSGGDRYQTFDSPKYIQDLIETMATTSEFRHRHIDAHLHRDDLKSILDDATLLAHYLTAKQTRLNLWGNTTHISVIDAQGNAASITSTNGEGSGRIIPGTGIHLNNMLGEEDLNPHGFFQWPPGVRLPSMMAPTMVFDGDDPILALGSAGSNRIRSAVTEVIERFVTFNTPIQAAIDAPRIHYERDEVFFEPGFDTATLEEVARHYKVTSFEDSNLFFGGVNAVTGDFQGGGDHRRGGAVVRVR
jgi:gamma-glutamyltranspeptidase/glutathione hydrolase